MVATIQRVGFFGPSSISPALASPRRTDYLFLISTLMVKLLLALRGCIVTRSDAEIATLEDLGTPQIGNAKLV
ncbi:hypothetical protein MTR67_008292 [Solanum verrucosum]|uniref:Uncharacterized protein n=1 Tax=Solanum verrucosum TaxID=315347 RepID=A0AAF0Q1A6_SOLVR|nr:hypothetical protein MTR67_008292 [Solanum verrucosum]